jgi:hypothetical protein
MPKLLIHIVPEKEAFFLELLAQLNGIEAVQRVGENEKKSVDETLLPPSWTLSVAEQEKHYVPFAQREIPDFIKTFFANAENRIQYSSTTKAKPKPTEKFSSLNLAPEEAEEAWRFLEDDY